MAHAPMIAYDEALSIVLRHCHALDARSIPLDEALGHVLAAPLVAHDVLPPAPMSNRDGYAVRAADLEGASEGAPVRLRVVGLVPCGTVPERGIAPGEAMQTMTGAIVCEGADAMVMVEDTTRVDDETVELRLAVPTGEHVRAPGSDVRPDELVLASGSIMGPAQIGLAATLGYGEVEVHRAPRVGILSTGDELLPPEAPLTPGKIRNANGFSLAAQVRRLGCPVRNLGTAPDRPDRILAMLESSLDRDVLIVSGGASVGEFDFIDEVLEKLGATIFFDRVAVKPGKPVTFATLGEHTLIFGLPGNPVSSLVSFELFCAPALRALAGRRELHPPRLTVRLKETVRCGKARRNYLRCTVTRNGAGHFEASLSGLQESFVTSGLAQANGLLVIEAGLGGAEVGSDCPALLLCDLSEVGS